MSFIERMKQARLEDDKVVHFKNAFPVVPDFETFVKSSQMVPKSKLRKENEFLTIYYTGEKLPMLYAFNGFKEFEDAMLKAFGLYLWNEPVMIYSQTTDHGSGLFMHVDPGKQIHWNCIGKALWTVIENGKEVKYIMEPGDVIYIPEGWKHGVITLEAPRAGMIYTGWSNDQIKNLNPTTLERY